jgi:hypothetical protein
MKPSSDIEMSDVTFDIRSSSPSRLGEVVALKPLGLRVALAGEHAVVDAGPCPFAPHWLLLLTLGSVTNPVQPHTQVDRSWSHAIPLISARSDPRP